MAQDETVYVLGDVLEGRIRRGELTRPQAIELKKKIDENVDLHYKQHGMPRTSPNKSNWKGYAEYYCGKCKHRHSTDDKERYIAHQRFATSPSTDYAADVKSLEQQQKTWTKTNPRQGKYW